MSRKLYGNRVINRIAFVFFDGGLWLTGVRRLSDTDQDPDRNQEYQQQCQQFEIHEIPPLIE